MESFPLVYRCAIVVKPRQAMVDWLKKIDFSFEVSFEELVEDSAVYLVPDLEEVEDIDEAIERFIKSNYKGIFLNELSGWLLDPETHPKMSYALFKEWFEISLHTLVYDMVNMPLDKD